MQHMKRKVVRPSDSDRQVKSGQFRRKSIETIESNRFKSSAHLKSGDICLAEIKEMETFEATALFTRLGTGNDNNNRYSKAIEFKFEEISGFQFALKLIDTELPEQLDTKLPEQLDPELSEQQFNEQNLAIQTIFKTVMNTTKYSNGQFSLVKKKNKELEMTPKALIELITSLHSDSKGCCALTKIKFEYDDANLSPSLDRIDSDGHYEKENLQLVCRFINFWKRNTENKVFKDQLKIFVQKQRVYNKSGV
jgi:hypothetical protein